MRTVQEERKRGEVMMKTINRICFWLNVISMSVLVCIYVSLGNIPAVCGWFIALGWYIDMKIVESENGKLRQLVEEIVEFMKGEQE